MKGSQLERSPLYLLYYLREVSRQTAAEVLFMLALFIVRIAREQPMGLTTYSVSKIREMECN